MVNAKSPTAGAGEADSVSSVSASACHISGPNSVSPGQIVLVYGINLVNLSKPWPEFVIDRNTKWHRRYVSEEILCINVCIRCAKSLCKTHINVSQTQSFKQQFQNFWKVSKTCGEDCNKMKKGNIFLPVVYATIPLTLTQHFTTFFFSFIPSLIQEATDSCA